MQAQHFLRFSATVSPSCGSPLDTLLNGSPTPQFVIDANHRVIFWNRALEIASGIKASEVYGTTDPWRASYAAKCPTLADLLVDGMIEQLPEMYKGKISRSQIIDGSYETLDFFPHIGKNGTWLHFTAIPVRDDKGVLLGAVETLIDVTERKRAEEALMANQFLLDDSMEMSHMAYWEYDQPSGIFTFNDRFYALYGTNADREGGYQMPADDYIKKFIHPEDIGRVQEVIAANSKGSQDSGTLSEVEHRIIRGDGKIRYINVCIRTARTKRVARSGSTVQTRILLISGKQRSPLKTPRRQPRSPLYCLRRCTRIYRSDLVLSIRNSVLSS